MKVLCTAFLDLQPVFVFFGESLAKKAALKVLVKLTKGRFESRLLIANPSGIEESVGSGFGLEIKIPPDFYGE